MLIKLIRSGMEHLASCPKAKVYSAANRGNPYFVAVKMDDPPSTQNKIFLTPWSLYKNISQQKPFVEAGIGAPSRPRHSILRLGCIKNSSFGLKSEHELHRI